MNRYFTSILIFLSNSIFSQDLRLGIPLRHTASVTTAEFSPDRKLVVTASDDNTAKIWAAISGKLIADLKGHNGHVISAKFSYDGKKIVTASADQTVKIWKVASGQLLTEIKVPFSELDSALFNIDGNIVFTISDNGFCQLWNTASGELIAKLEGKISGKSAFSLTGKKIVTVCSDSFFGAKIWNARNGKLITDINAYEINKCEDGFVGRAEFSPNGKLIVTASDRNLTKIWNAETGKFITELKMREGAIFSTAFSPDSKRFVTGNSFGEVQSWDIQTGKLIVDLEGHGNLVYSVIYSDDGKRIVSQSWDDRTHLWDAVTGKLIVELDTNNISTIYKSISFSPDGKKIAISEDSIIKIRNASDGKLLAFLKGHKSKVLKVVFRNDGKQILTASSDNTCKIWDIASGSLTANLTGNSRTITSAQFSPSGKKIITITDDKSPKIWDVVSGKLLSYLKGHVKTVTSAIFSPDETKIFTTSKDSTFKIWDAVSGKILSDIKGLKTEVFYIIPNPLGEKVLTIDFASEPKLWDATSGQFLIEFKNHDNNERDGFVYTAIFSPDGKKIVAIRFNNKPEIWNVVSGKFMALIEGSLEPMDSRAFTPDCKKIITRCYDSTAKVWDLENGELKFVLKMNSHIKAAYFSTDGSKIITVNSNDSVLVWDAADGKLSNNLTGHKNEISYSALSPDGSKIVTWAEYNDTAKVWDASNGRLLANFKGGSTINSVFFSPDGDKIISRYYDYSIAKIWDAQTGKLITTIDGGANSVLQKFDFINNRIVGINNSELKFFDLNTGRQLMSFFAIDSTDYLTQLPSGYYHCSPRAAKLLYYVTKELKVITFEQLDVKYNRPDKVLEAIGNTDTSLIKSYRKAYEKRIKRLGIDTSAFRDGYSVPEADFANRESLEYEQASDKLQLNIKAIDSTYALDRYNVWVNGSPLFGRNGSSIRIKKEKTFSGSVTVPLSDGENRIETSVINANGTESYRSPMYVKYTPGVAAQEKLHFIGIGIDRFADSTYNLKYSVKDIRDLSGRLKKKYGDNITIDTLFDENVTVSNVRLLRKKLEQTSVNDKVIVSYSGHGLLSKDFDYYLSTYSVNFDSAKQNGLPYDELEDLIDSIPARKKLMLVDACHSGEVDKDELQRLNAVADSLHLKRGIKPVAYKKDEAHLGMKNSFELMQQLFVNVDKNTGATVISAAGGTQFALERGDLQNGVFTFCILEYMLTHEHATVNELKQYVNKRVPELTGGMQQPTTRTENIEADWRVW